MRPKHEQTTIGEILELSPNPNRTEIDRNYKRLVRQYHPDINKNPHAEEAMKRINRADAIVTGKELPPKQPQQTTQQPTVIITTYTWAAGGTNYTSTSSSGSVGWY